MPNPARIPTIDEDNPFSNQADQTVQIQEALFNLKVALLAAGGGGTVDRSSDTVAADGTDRWVTAANVVLGLAGAGSWIAGTLGGDYGGSTLFFLLFINDTDGGAGNRPQTFGLRISTAVYTGGTTAALPTTVGTETTVNTQGDDILTWTDPIAGRWNSWITANGDVFFVVKEEGQQEFNFFLMLHAFTDADGGGKGANRFGLFTKSTAGGNSATLLFLSTTAHWESISPGGTFNGAGEMHSVMAQITSLTSGLDFEGALIPDDLKLFVDDIAANGGRFVGLPPDLFATDIDAAWGLLDDTETGQTFRRFCTGDGVIIYFPTASVPPA